MICQFLFHSKKLYCEFASFQIIMYSVTVWPVVVSLFQPQWEFSVQRWTYDCFSFTLKGRPDPVPSHDQNSWCVKWLEHNPSEALVWCMHVTEKIKKCKRYFLVTAEQIHGPRRRRLLTVYFYQVNSLYSNWQYVGCFWSVLFFSDNTDGRFIIVY